MLVCHPHAHSPYRRRRPPPPSARPSRRTCSSPGCPPTSSLWRPHPSSPTPPGKREQPGLGGAALPVQRALGGSQSTRCGCTVSRRASPQPSSGGLTPPLRFPHRPFPRSCALTEAQMAVNAVKSQAVEGDKALVMADLMQVWIIEHASRALVLHPVQRVAPGQHEQHGRVWAVPAGWLPQRAAMRCAAANAPLLHSTPRPPPPPPPADRGDDPAARRGALPLPRPGGLPGELPHAGHRRRAGVHYMQCVAEGLHNKPHGCVGGELACAVRQLACATRVAVRQLCACAPQAHRPPTPACLPACLPRVQSNCPRGSSCTVYANATELFSNIDQSMPKFSDWLHQAMGINSSATLEVSEAPPARPLPLSAASACCPTAGGVGWAAPGGPSAAWQPHGSAR